MANESRSKTTENVPEAANVNLDAWVELSYDPEGNTANMILHGPVGMGRPIPISQAMSEIERAGITTGIDEAAVKGMIDGKMYEVPVCVARAIPAKRGESGHIIYRFEQNRVPKPKHDEFGVADYHELNLIVPIRRGEIIADIKLPTQGEPGVNIFGHAIPPEPGKAANVTIGKNTLLTVDGKNIVAACDGHITYGTGCFNVDTTVTVRSDLDLSVGNIDFFGDVLIKGNVLEGFSVKAGRSLKIEGTVFSADVAAEGDITIKGGVIGSNVDGGADIKIGFCENSKIKAKGNIESTQFAFCEVFCYGELIAKGKTGIINGGSITSMKNVTAGIIGSEKYTSTLINIGDGSVIVARKAEAEDDLKFADERYEQAIKNVEFLKMRKEAQGGKLTDVQARQLKTEIQNKVYFSVRRKDLQAYIAQLESDLQHRDDLCAMVGTRIYPGSHFCINYLSLDVTEMYGRSKICIINDNVQVLNM